ncbi:MAG: putative multidrug export ATP-binding/permease protein [Anaerolineae bacterium]|nr:putative multidrug export ATP-binding/permease protein [Anaerolineae bacterium]
MWYTFRLMAKREFTVANEYIYNRTTPVRWILAHVWRYPGLPILAVVATIVNNLAYSYIQVYVGRGFDLITTADWQTTALAWIALGAVTMAVLQGLSGLGRNYLGEFLAQRIERDTRDELYVSLLGKSQTFHGQQRIGDIMARATNDVRAVNMMFSPGLTLILDSVIAAVTPLLVIAQIRLELLLTPVLFLVLFAITVNHYNRRLKPVSVAMRTQFGVMNAGLAEAIAGVETVKANVQERYEWDKFTQNARIYRDYFIQVGKIQAQYLPMLMFSLAWGAAFLHALLMWRAGQISLGQVVAFMGLVGLYRFVSFISIFSFNLVQLGLASAERILAILKIETDLDQNEAGVGQPLAGQVSFENVSFGYNGSAVLKNVSFAIEPGQTVALVGQTGSGKTSLTRLINRIFDTDSGRVLVDGVNVRDWSLESLRSQISTIEQDVFLFSGTIAENIAFGCADASPAEIEEAAKQAQAHDFIMNFADGYRTEVGERGVTLSGGQRQRIAIARAFLTNPRILILDDSTSAIDSATEDRIQRAMRRISEQRTTFLITHRLSQIRWADHILVLRRGELVDQGTHDDLLARSPEYQKIFSVYE